jgi:hypothetical protein
MNIVGIEKTYADESEIGPGHSATFEILADPSSLVDDPEFFKLSYDWD